MNGTSTSTVEVSAYVTPNVPMSNKDISANS